MHKPLPNSTQITRPGFLGKLTPLLQNRHAMLAVAAVLFLVAFAYFLFEEISRERETHVLLCLVVVQFAMIIWLLLTRHRCLHIQSQALHEHLTTVLDALDASISVMGGDELLFANQLYRRWFGSQARGHLKLVAEAGINAANIGVAASAEIYLSDINRWLEVRTRCLTWVDGRQAQMVIATDISARRTARYELQAGVAHELNQPLTAINNYCNGMVSRIKSQQIAPAELLNTLEKTARQAHRAGQIIHHIRSFVKRSEHHRTASGVGTLVSEAVELAEIELRRRNVKLVSSVANGLPNLRVDAILIEQVLVNLIKNAAESIDSAQRPEAQRTIELSVALAEVNHKPVIEFKVIDSGGGMAPEVMARMYETSTKADGMGMGLSLCRSIVESYMGRITAANIYNGQLVAGCCFTFWIPAPMPADPA